MNPFVLRAIAGLGLVTGIGLSAGCAQPDESSNVPQASAQSEPLVVDPADDVETAPALEAKLLAGDVDDASSIAFLPATAAPAGLRAGFRPASLADLTGGNALASAPADDAPESQSAASESTPESGGTAIDAAATDAVAAQKPAGKLGYAGGPVMEHQNVYFIYYGNWKNTTRTRSLLHAFIDSLHSNNFNHDLMKGLRYRDHAGHLAGSRGIRLGGAVSVGYPYGRNLHDGATANVVHSVLNAGKLSPDKSGIYVVMRSEDVGGDIDDLCGWHSNQTMDIRFQDNYRVLENIKFATVQHPARPIPGGYVCSAFYGSDGSRVRTPNRDWVADSEVSILSHEMLETMSDPNGDAWRNRYWDNGSIVTEEGSDLCAWKFPSRRGVNGSSANIYDRHQRRWWLIQAELQNNSVCSMGPLR